MAGKTFRLALSIILVFLFLGLFSYFGRDSLQLWLVFFGAMLLGVILGVLSFRRIAEQQWPVLKPHIDEASVKERLDQLKNT